ncbi:MAG: DUF429 domain-containing protein [Candidatus Bathyarchaeota archaeon]
MYAKVVGIDLAGSIKRPTGFCLMDGNLKVKTSILYEDKEIIEKTVLTKPDIVSVDAPLALPKGRCCLKDDCLCRNAGHLRECDKVLLKMKIKFFPLTLGPMRKLTLRGIRIKKELNGKGLNVIESFPYSVKKILGFPEKKHELDKFRNALKSLGIDGDINKKDISIHELDAITSALVGLMYLKGEAVEIGDPSEALMVIPKPRNFQYKHAL